MENAAAVYGSAYPMGARMMSGHTEFTRTITAMN